MEYIQQSFAYLCTCFEAKILWIRFYLGKEWEEDGTQGQWDGHGIEKNNHQNVSNVFKAAFV